MLSSYIHQELESALPGHDRRAQLGAPFKRTCYQGADPAPIHQPLLTPHADYGGGGNCYIHNAGQAYSEINKLQSEEICPMVLSPI
jgi:hypothetical protein